MLNTLESWQFYDESCILGDMSQLRAPWSLQKQNVGMLPYLQGATTRLLWHGSRTRERLSCLSTQLDYGS